MVGRYLAAKAFASWLSVQGDGVRTTVRGLFAALAKRQGLCLASATLCVGTHSPTLWHLEGMNETADADALEVDFMERETAARADVLWSPSRYMASWMRREGWRLPRRVLFRHCPLPDAPSAGRRAVGPRPELVFFGRLESRKGLELFCDALDRIVSAGQMPAFMRSVKWSTFIPNLNYPFMPLSMASIPTCRRMSWSPPPRKCR